MGTKVFPLIIGPLWLATSYPSFMGSFSKKKLSLWLENQGKWTKGQVGFRRHHSTIDHFVTLRIIAEEWRNSKIDLFYCFVGFRKPSTLSPEISSGIGLKRSWFLLNWGLLWSASTKLLPSLSPTKGGLKILNVISRLSEIVPFPPPFLVFTSIN